MNTSKSNTSMNVFSQIFEEFNNAADLNEGGEAGKRKVIRPKYLPHSKTEAELYDASLRIPAGPMYSQNFSADHDADISIAGGDPFTPRPKIEHFQSFADFKFSAEIMENIRKMGYHMPLQIQKAVIPLIQDTTSDIMGHAHTGSGKSAAFFLPLIDKLLQSRRAGLIAPANYEAPYVIVVAPVRELVIQLNEDARKFATGAPVSVALAIGDVPMGVSIRNVRDGCDILVTTIGRLCHYVKDQIIKLNNLRYLVLDEADKFLQYEDTRRLLSEMKKLISPELNHRTLMFSATFDENIQKIAREYLKPDFFFVHVGELNQTVSTVTQTIIKVELYEKTKLLLELLLDKSRPSVHLAPNGKPFFETEKTIIFINGRRECDRLGIVLACKQFRVQTLNSSRTQRQRSEAMDQFTRGRYDILVGTDVLARGLNIPNVSHVINYDMPREMHFEQYVHRIGRTGRAGNVGRSTTFFNPHSVELLHAEPLVHVLQRSNQVVPEFLRNIVERLNNARARREAQEFGELEPGEETGENNHSGNAWNDADSLISFC